MKQLHRAVAALAAISLLLTVEARAAEVKVLASNTMKTVIEQLGPRGQTSEVSKTSEVLQGDQPAAP